MPQPLAVYLEVARRRTFAGAIEWPGWARSGKTEDDALAALVDYGPRYAKAIGRAANGLTAPKSVSDVDVRERLDGDASTEFGVPGMAPAADERPLDAKELDRLSSILQATWRYLDRCIEKARGVPLRKGPRGGGRELEAIVGHVVEAEASYVYKLGLRFRSEEKAPVDERAAALRRGVLDTLDARLRGEVDTTGRRAPLWSPRYFVRRAAWHVLDHAWEIEDRATPE
jgi:hypothetical protein